MPGESTVFSYPTYVGGGSRRLLCIRHLVAVSALPLPLSSTLYADRSQGVHMPLLAALYVR